MRNTQNKVDDMMAGHGSRAARGTGRVSLLFALWFLSSLWVQAGWPGVAYSDDGTPIAYDVVGAGEPALVFVHGWSCDARYWREQVPVFSKKHKVITLDLAGHGHSGMAREVYSMQAFADDVCAIIQATESSKVILIGHSMGGIVIAEAARRCPERVIGLIGVDNLQDITFRLTPEQRDEMVGPIKSDFVKGTRAFVSQMIRPETDASLREWIMTDMASAPPQVAVSAMDEMLSLYMDDQVATLFDALSLPVVVVNADQWPVNFEANRKHMSSFDAIVLKASDHFLMMNKPGEFNDALDQAIQMVLDPKPQNP